MSILAADSHNPLIPPVGEIIVPTESGESLEIE